MHPFLCKILQTIESFEMLEPHDRVLVGVSGGADSVCLIVALKELGYNVAAAHVNHGLRGQESDEDEVFTKQLANDLGIECFSKKVSLGPGNIEAAGRQARKQFFRELVQDRGFTKIALAHTKNDRVETFLMNLLRGSGIGGLTSMPAISDNTIRPFVETARTEIEAYLTEGSCTWRTDSSNFDLRFARNRVRQEVIPALAAEFNPNLVETLARTIQIVEAEDAWMAAVADDWINANGTNKEETFVLRAGNMHSVPPSLVRRVLRGALRRAGSELRDVSFEHIEAVRGLLESGKSGKFVEIPGGLQVAREFDFLVFRHPILTVSYEYELKIPGQVYIPEIKKVFRAEIADVEGADTAVQRVFVDAESIGHHVRIRNWKPGDYYKPVGLPSGKLKKLFQRARIPRSHRTRWPVVVADSTIVWVASFPVSREFVPRGHSQKIVVFEAFEASGDLGVTIAKR
jgi:tRNA(Ile)-lysidine synthase